MKRIEFFKEQEGFKDEDFDEMDEGKLLKTLRVTKNMLFLSEQLPNANYDSNFPKNHDKEKNSNTINNTTKSTKINSTLPNITSSNSLSRYNASNEEIIIPSSNKILNKYSISKNGSKTNLPKNKNQENLKSIIKTENALISKNNENKKKISNKESLRSIDHELVNNLPSHRLYQQKKAQSKKDKDFLKYIGGLGGNIYLRYGNQNEINKYNSNRNRVNINHKSMNKNGQYLPSIYRNKYSI